MLEKTDIFGYHIKDTEEPDICEALGLQTEDEEPVQEFESEGRLVEKPGMRSLRGRDLARECGQHCPITHRSHTGVKDGGPRVSQAWIQFVALLSDLIRVP